MALAGPASAAPAPKACKSVSNSISYRCSLVPTLPRDQACIGGGTLIRFATPTGG